MTVRKIKPSHGYAFRGKEPSPKSKTGMVYWESLLELGAVKRFNFDMHIDEIEHQPVTLKFHYRGKVYHYTPDFRLGTTAGENVLIEVKPGKYASDPLVRAKLEVGRQYAVNKGWDFNVLREEDIYKGHLQDNLDLLLDVRDYPLDRADADIIVKRLRSMKQECTPEDLRKRIGTIPPSRFYMSLYLLIYQQRIYTDLINLPLDNDGSLIRVVRKGDWNMYVVL